MTTEQKRELSHIMEQKLDRQIERIKKCGSLIFSQELAASEEGLNSQDINV